MYNVHISAAPAGSDSNIVTPASYARPAPSGQDNTGNILKYPNAHYHGYDTEVISGSLLSGINTRASPPFVNLNIAVAVPASMSLIAWGMSDVILAFDVNSQSVQAYV
jgi:hypothetical protein